MVPYVVDAVTVMHVLLFCCMCVCCENVRCEGDRNAGVGSGGCVCVYGCFV